ncbi:MAG TPA: helix-turn-helix domain-containing protein [Dyadobacter sp.]|nr:helix-turn-helix domain-containing protein [Dyadobacter sp.]
MHVEMITREDLQQFKADLLAELKTLLSTTKQSPQGKWLKSAQVRSLLNISPGTLLSLRVNGHLRYTKVGGIFYYEYRDIEQMLAKDNSKRL